MSVNQDSTALMLPCLQSIGPWWTLEDRINLFCHLLKIFPFDETYICSIPQSAYDNQQKISTADVTKEYVRFGKNTEGKNISCSTIRKIDFSFGKLNSRLCYLCPFSGTYKNKRLNNERKCLHCIDKHPSLKASDLLSNANLKSDDVFHYHYPIFIGDVLIDALPASFILQKYAELETCHEDAEEIWKQLSYELSKEIEKRIKYHRIKHLYQKCNSNYMTEAALGGQSEIRKIRDLNLDASISNQIVTKRLFNSLAGQKVKYKPLKPAEYDYMGCPSIPDMSSDNSSLHTPFSTETVSCEDTIVKETPSSLPDDEFWIDLESDHYRNLPELKQSNSASPVYPLREEKEDEPDQLIALCKTDMVSSHETIASHDSNDFIEDSPIADQKATPVVDVTCDGFKTATFDRFMDFYFIDLPEHVFNIGDHDPDTRELLRSLDTENGFYCMEPVIANNIEGLLIMDCYEKFYFYPIQLYGKRTIIKIADAKVPVFTCSSHALFKYLYREKVYGISPHDLSLAMTIKNPSERFTFLNIFKYETIDACMKCYKEAFHRIMDALSNQQEDLYWLNLQYSSIIASTGRKPPFDGINSLFVQDTALSFSPKYTGLETPERSGMMIRLRFDPSYTASKDCDTELLFKRIIADFSEQINFKDGHAYLLSLDKSAVSIYITGDCIAHTKAKYYLMASYERILNNHPSYGYVHFKMDHKTIEIRNN